jgi:hypothetical protein
MAEVNPMNKVAMTLLFRRLGLMDAASQFLIKDQAISNLETLFDLTEKEIEMLCKITRKPGGQIEVAIPADGRRNATTHMVSNPGIPVATLHEKNMKLAHFFLKYKMMTSRTVIYDNVTVPAIKALMDYKIKIAERAVKELPALDLIPNLTHERIFEWFDEFREFLTPLIGIEILSPSTTQHNARTARTSPSTLKHQRSIPKITFTSSTWPFKPIIRIQTE